MSLDPLFKKAFGDDQPTRVGSGWVSGVLSVVLGVIAVGTVLCFRFPQLLTTPGLRSLYPTELLRRLLQLIIVSGFALALVSAALRRRKALAGVGLLLACTATLLGGAAVPLPDHVDTPVGIGLDWFLLNLLALTTVFVPLERAAPRDAEQEVFRPGWTTDGVHFLASHLLVQLFSFVALVPAVAMRDLIVPLPLRQLTASLPLVAQFLGVVALADLSQYFVHRALHRVPLLWRLHAVHHSSPTLDWLAGSRLHLLDALLTRTLSVAPVLLLAFSPEAIQAYFVFVSFHAVFIHANFGPRLGWLEPVLVTPRVHHFHHAAEPEAVDRNFAVHLSFIDRLFGTQFLPPGRWPRRYGLAESVDFPAGWWGQLAYPWRRPKAAR